MKDNETIVEMITRFINIVNGIEALGKTYKELEMVMKILRSLPSKWDANVTVIQEAKDLTKLHVRKIRLIQPMVITLKGGGEGWIGWWSLFANLNYVNEETNYMQVYNK